MDRCPGLTEKIQKFHPIEYKIQMRFIGQAG
jgi:hypothetical protein